MGSMSRIHAPPSLQHSVLSYGTKSRIASPSDSTDSSDVSPRPGIAWPPSAALTGVIREEPANQVALSQMVTFLRRDVAKVFASSRLIRKS